MLSAGLPNITGVVQTILEEWTNGGAFYSSNYADDNTEIFDRNGTGGWGIARYLNFNASRFNAIYGASTTVQPPALSLIPQIRF